MNVESFVQLRGVYYRQDCPRKALKGGGECAHQQLDHIECCKSQGIRGKCLDLCVENMGDRKVDLCCQLNVLDNESLCRFNPTRTLAASAKCTSSASAMRRTSTRLSREEICKRTLHSFRHSPLNTIVTTPLSEMKQHFGEFAHSCQCLVLL